MELIGSKHKNPTKCKSTKHDFKRDLQLKNCIKCFLQTILQRKGMQKARKLSQLLIRPAKDKKNFYEF